MKFFALITIMVLLYCCNNRNDLDNKIIHTNQSANDLFDSLNKQLNFDGSVQFYYPYRGYRKSVIRVILDSPYSVIFDLTKTGNVTFFNKESRSDFMVFAGRFFEGDINKAKKFAINKVAKYKKAGIYDIAKGTGFLHIQTMYMDSSYNLMRQANPNYRDSFYLYLTKQNSDFEGYCFAYYFFEENQSSLPFTSQRKVKKLNDKLFYYREPIKITQSR